MRFKIFGDYFLVISCGDYPFSVISLKRNSERVIRPTVRAKSLYYVLYENGVRTEYSLKKIIKIAFFQTSFK